jgi:hypothetical protein
VNASGCRLAEDVRNKSVKTKLPWLAIAREPRRERVEGLPHSLEGEHESLHAVFTEGAA